jgi:hypothetical protein
MRKFHCAVAIAAVALSLGAIPIAAQEEAADVAGAWELTWQARQGPRTMALELEQDGEILTGTVTSSQGQELPVSGSITGDQISFSVTYQGRRGEVTLTFSGTVDGDSMNGTVETGGEPREWMATRGGA